MAKRYNPGTFDEDPFRSMNEGEYAAGLYRGPDGTSSNTRGQPRRIAEPVIQYAKASDGVSIAYYSIGAGPPLIYMTPRSHLEREWQYPEQRAWLERMAEDRRLIRFDRRGTGLSDRDREFDFNDLLHDIEAVVRKEGLERFALMARVSSAALAIRYAFRYPQQVSHLILFCPYIHNRDHLGSSPPHQAVRAAAQFDWKTYTQLLAELTTGWVDMDQARRYASYLRECVGGYAHQGFVDRFTDSDMTRELTRLTMPVLVLQRKDAVFPTVEDARRIAANPPKAELILLDGSAAVPFLGDTDAVLAAVNRFLSETSEPRPGGLTERELEILTLLARGASSSGIANDLSISTRTVDRHIGNIYRKIGAHNRAEATAYTYERGIAPVV
jgi:pimeloyl-ACP methyl ester carboxylesterase/DNA-binding CsgD family transcriptional regulator